MKNYNRVISYVFGEFLGEHVKFLRQEYSWLNQRKSFMFRPDHVWIHMEKKA